MILAPGCPQPGTVAGVRRVAGPTSEIVTPEEAKLRLRVDSDAEIDVIAEMIVNARESLEAYLQRSIAKQTWQADIAGFPCDGTGISLPRPPIIEVVSLNYIDANSVQQTLSSSAFTLMGDEDSARIILNEGYSWPTARAVNPGLTVEYIAGYATVPERFRGYIFGLLAIWFDDRTKQGQMPPGFAASDRVFA
jgi:uncharacterized phiE125 gp8 family phage protein